MCKATHLPLNPQKQVIKKRRRVTFAKGKGDLEVKTSIRLIQPISKEDGHNVYYSRFEKGQMKVEAREVADDTYDQNNNKSSSFNSIMLRAFTSCHNDDLTEKELRFIIQWTATDQCLRGMEKTAVRGLCKKMAVCRRAALQSVVEDHSVAMANHGYLSKATREAISKKYHKLSAPSTKYAFLKAKADEEALKILEAPHKQLRDRRSRCEPLRTPFSAGTMSQFWEPTPETMTTSCR